ncbi:hypothetical protein EGI22_07150 [Lacihabitans sp. LS3-19]|uniref:hypothetical protein n=1 Tax=Lacihabitans sp. LS3-19 TaxID=2487335 RepID=UPI0020CD28D8|nr:hypothetical protein [Lacihabitans sp. LS3-19]MCP9767684.1 hypothetical protein [Lacihabitans sp. LS3-19]
MKYFVFIILTIFSQPIFAQLVETVDVEIPLRNDVDDDFSVISLDTNGVLVINSQSNFFGRKGKLIYSKFDNNLQKIWINTIDPGISFSLIKYFQSKNYLYCLLRESDTRKVKIVKLDLEKGDAVITETKMLTDMDVEFFAAIDTKVIILGKYNDKPVAELHRLFDLSAKVLPQIYSNHIKVLSLEINENSKEIYLMLKDDKKCQFKFTVFDEEGKLLYMKDLGDKRHVVQNSKVLKLPDNKYFLAGNFAENCSEYSSGFYFTPVEDFEDIQYFKFSELQNYYSYLSAKKQEKIQKRLSLKREKGKDPKIRQRLNLQQPILDNGKVLLVAEVFYPEYKNNMSYSRSNLIHLGENYRTQRDFNNYKYTQSLFFTFDGNGKKTWDYSIDLKNLESAVLNNKVQASFVNEGILVAYAKDETIFIKLIGDHRDPVDFVPIDLAKKDNIFLSDVTVDLFSWYNKNFLAFGYKTVRNPNDIGNQEYFFLSKLSFTFPELN